MIDRFTEPSLKCKDCGHVTYSSHRDHAPAFDGGECFECSSGSVVVRRSLRLSLQFLLSIIAITILFVFTFVGVSAWVIVRLV